jgi:uncharacterized membrane protein YhaH (DUF805 family)
VSSYTAKDITVLEGLEPVRKRPGMYIGGVGTAGLHHLVWEILDNAVDEAMNGHAANIAVALHKDASSLTIQDDGRGIPVDKHPQTKTSALEVIFTTLHAGGKFEGQNYKTAGGLHGVGASVVNALSRELIATVRRDGSTWEQRYKQGVPQGGVKKIGPARGTGTTVFFRPDSTIFPKTEFDAATIRERLEIASYLHKGVKILFENEAAEGDQPKREVFQHDEGLGDYLKKILAERRANPVHDQPFALVKTPWYGTRSFHELVAVVGVLLFLGSLIGWSIAFFARFRKREQRPLLSRLARWVAIIFGIALLVLLFTLVGLMTDNLPAFGVPRLYFENPSSLDLLMAIPPLMAILAALVILVETYRRCTPGLWLGIWALIWFGCLRGTVGPNQYGPDPLEGKV